MPLIYLREIVKKYKNANALNGLDLDIYDGEFLIIMGPSGSGKSTLMNIIAGLDFPNSGVFNYKGFDMMKSSENMRSLFRQKVVGIIFQRYNLLGKLTVIENLRLSAWVKKGENLRDVLKKFEETINQEIPDKERKQAVGNLSQGEQQRVAVTRSIINDPEIILADEPTGNLDAENGIKVIELLKKLNTEKKKTVVLVTHNPDYKRYADRIVYVNDGKVDHIDVINEKKLFVDYKDNVLLSSKPFKLGFRKTLYLLRSTLTKQKAKLFSTLFLISIGIAALSIFISNFDFVTSAVYFPTRYQAENQIIVSGLGQNYTYIQDSPFAYDDLSLGRVIDKNTLNYINSIKYVSNSYPVLFYKVVVKDPQLPISFFAISGPQVKHVNPPVDPVLYGTYFKSDFENSITISQDVAKAIAKEKGLASEADVVGQYIPVEVSLRERDLSHNVDLLENLKISGVLIGSSGDYGMPELPNNFDNLINSNVISNYDAIVVNVSSLNRVSSVDQGIRSLGYDTVTFPSYHLYEENTLAAGDVVLCICAVFAVASIFLGFINILGLTIYQRMKEIVSLISVGTRTIDIKKYIFFESFILSLIIGTFGILLGYILEIFITFALNSTPMLQSLGVITFQYFQIDQYSVFLPFLFAVVVGFIETVYISTTVSSKDKLVDTLKRE